MMVFKNQKEAIMKKCRAIECEEKRNYWEGMLSKWETSGLSQIEFCRQNDLNRHRFYYWKRRIKKCTMSIPLVQLGGLPSFSGKNFPETPKLGLNIDGRFRIEICNGFNPATLEQLIRTLCRI
jgi:hypothetical protein